MQLLQLRYFCKLAQKQHLTSVANELLVSPSSLSTTIKKLEEEVGVPLFDRMGRGIRLNKAGEIFYKHVTRATVLLDEGLSMAQKTVLNQKGLQICVASPRLWDPIFEQFRTLYPDISLQIIVVTNPSGVQTQPFDFFLGNLYDIELLPLRREQLLKPERCFVLMNRSHPLARRESLEFKDLKNETFFSFSISSDMNKRQYTLQLLHEAEIFPRIIEGDGLSRYMMLEQNKCISLATNIGLLRNYPDLSHIVAIPVSTPICFPRTQVIAWNDDIPQNESRGLFHDFIVKSSSELDRESERILATLSVRDDT